MKSTSLILGAVLCTIGLSAVQAANPPENTPLFWPENRLIPIQVSYKQAMVDGLEFTITEFANGALPLYTPSIKQWKQVANLTYRNASAAFTNNQNPTIITGISLVKAKDWLGTLDKDSLNRYVEGIKNLHPGRFTLLNADSDFAPLSGSGFLAGKPYRMVHYQLASKEDPNSIIEVRDFISQVNDILVVLSFESPKALATRNSGMALNLLSSLTCLDDLE